MKTKEKLTTKNIRVGLKIQSVDNPEWGTWRVSAHYDKGIWEIDGDAGGTVLFENEFKFWELI